MRPAAEDAAGPPSPGVRGHPNPGLLPFTFQKTKTPVPAGRLLAGGAALLQLREVALSTVTPLVPTWAAPPSTVGSPSPPPAPGDGPSAGCRGAPAPRWFLNGKNGSTRCRRRRGRDQNRGSPGRGTRSRRAPRPSRGRLGPPGGSTGSVTPLLGTGAGRPRPLSAEAAAAGGDVGAARAPQGVRRRTDTRRPEDAGFARATPERQVCPPQKQSPAPHSEGPPQGRSLCRGPRASPYLPVPPCCTPSSPSEAPAASQNP